MAQIITIEFSDGQWELIKEHLSTGDLADDSEWTAEKMAEYLHYRIKTEVTFQIEQKAMQAQRDVFNV